MTDTVNLHSAATKNIIGDETTATLELENISSGRILRLQNAGGTGIQLSAISCPTTSIQVTATGKAIALEGGAANTINSAASAAEALVLSNKSTIVSSPTVATLQLVQSAASGAVLSVAGVFMSTASVNLAANKTAFVIPVRHESEDIVGYIAVSQGVV